MADGTTIAATPGVASIRPSDMVEPGGLVPVDCKVTWRTCRVELFDYVTRTGEVKATTTAARVEYVDDEGQEYVVHYSASDPGRFAPSEDGKSFVPLGEAKFLPKGSNFSVLMTALVNAGFPENRLSGDLSVLDGLYTYNKGIPEPKRAGLKRPEPTPGEPVRERVISVPSEILRLPWEKGKQDRARTTRPTGVTVKTAAPAPTPAVSASAAPVPVEATAPVGPSSSTVESDGAGAEAAALQVLLKALDGQPSVTRRDLGIRIFRELAKDALRDDVLACVFKPEFTVALMSAGLTLGKDGETISRV